MNKIKRVSTAFMWLFIFLFIALPLEQIIGWLHAPNTWEALNHTIILNAIPAVYQSGTQACQILHPLTMLDKLSGFLVSMIPTGIMMAVMWYLMRLFRLYAKGVIFTLRNVAYIRKIGYALLIGQLVSPIYEAMMGLVLTYGNPVGQRCFTATLDQTNIAVVLIALLIVLISWIMAEGCKLQEDQQLTI